jgi:hypothetical protein
LFYKSQTVDTIPVEDEDWGGSFAACARDSVKGAVKSGTNVTMVVLTVAAFGVFLCITVFFLFVRRQPAAASLSTSYTKKKRDSFTGGRRYVVLDDDVDHFSINDDEENLLDQLSGEVNV